MITKKQAKANKKNALVSTGPLTEKGKAIVAQNAVKHGIFANDLVIACGNGKEDEKEYKKLLEGLVVSLAPSGQMERLLVEKIAADFWRLRRVLRFEAGSITTHLSKIKSGYYNTKDRHGAKINQTNAEIDTRFEELENCLDWSSNFIKALRNGIIDSDEPDWSSEEIQKEVIVDHLDDVIRINGYTLLWQGKEFEKFRNGTIDFERLRTIFHRSGYSDRDLATGIIKKLEKFYEEDQEEIAELRKTKLKNQFAEDLILRTFSLPPDEDAEKVLRYEKSIQKSIFQNLALLKNLQRNS